MDRENAHLCRCPCTLPPEEQRCTDSFCQSLSGVLCFGTKDKVIHGWEIFPFPNSILHILFFRVLCWVVFFFFFFSLSAVYLPFLLWSYFCCWEDLSLPSLSIPSFLPFIVTKTSILYVLQSPTVVINSNWTRSYSTGESSAQQCVNQHWRK